MRGLRELKRKHAAFLRRSAAGSRGRGECRCLRKAARNRALPSLSLGSSKKARSIVMLNVLPKRRGRQNSMHLYPSLRTSAMRPALSTTTEPSIAEAKLSSPMGSCFSPERSMMRALAYFQTPGPQGSRRAPMSQSCASLMRPTVSTPRIAARPSMRATPAGTSIAHPTGGSIL